VPSSSRQNYDLSDYSDAQLRQLAALKSIRQTWPSLEQRNAAMERLQLLLGSSRHSASVGTAQFRFPINDNVVYTSADDFLSPTNADLFATTLSMRQQKADVEMRLERLRKQYHEATRAERASLAEDISEAEKTVYRISNDIAKLEKTIRNKENLLLTK
jgi:DNA gyrase/topoisomerase IV subunit A